MDRELDKLLKEWRREVGKISPNLLPLVNKFIAGFKGGKGLRGKLVILGYELAHLPGVKAHLEGEITKVAAAYEIFHTSILAHDDIIDQSELRRNQPSLYKSVGVEQAITLADAGFFLTVKIIAGTNFSDKLKIQALQMFSQTMVETAVGQMLDIQKGDPFTIMKLKTAEYSVAGPLKLGALLGGANQRLIKVLGEFGENLGIAFQIKDDILDKEVRSVELALQEALQYTNKARKIIPKIAKNSKMRKTLNELVDYMVERTT